MAIHTSYTDAREHLAALCDEVAANNEVVIIQRRGAQDVALISVTELRSLQETAHLLRSPRNAERLVKALARAEARAGTPATSEELRHEVGLAED